MLHLNNRDFSQVFLILYINIVYAIKKNKVHLFKTFLLYS